MGCSCAALLRNADAMKLHNEQSAVLNQALSAVLAEYTTGKVPQVDVLRAQMALTRLSEHLIELEEERDSARAQLNELMGRSPAEAIEIAGSYRTPETLPPIEELERVAIEHRPELAALRKQIAKSGDESQLARLSMKPDLTVAAGYMLMPTGSFSRSAYMAELTMNLPSLNRARHDGETKQADAATEVVQAELDARRQRTMDRLDSSLRKCFPYIVITMCSGRNLFVTEGTKGITLPNILHRFACLCVAQRSASVTPGPAIP